MMNRAGRFFTISQMDMHIGDCILIDPPLPQESHIFLHENCSWSRKSGRMSDFWCIFPIEREDPCT